MDPATLLKFITNSTWIVTQLLGEEIVKFEKDFYEVKIKENEFTTGAILQLRARVLLEDEPMEYFIKEKDKSPPFALDSKSGQLYLLETLDYEIESEHLLTIVARVKEFSAEVDVRIEVEDVNEYRPVFSRQTYETQITEEDDRHLPKVILRVSASDPDGGKWGEVRYVLSGEGAATGNTLSRAGITRSAQHPRSKLRVRPSKEIPLFTSSGEPPLGEEVRLRRRKGGDEKGKPTFTHQRYSDFSQRNKRNEEDIFIVYKKLFKKPTEFKEKPKLLRRVTFQKENTFVTTWEKDSILDFLTHGPFHLSTQEKERAKEEDFEKVKDVESASRLPREVHFQTQSSAVKSAPEASSVTRSSLSEKRSEFFWVDSTRGDVLLLRPLDRDPPNGRSQWHLTVTVTDGIWNDTSDVIINVKDVNDNSPFFPNLIEMATVKENSPSETFVIRVSAIDNDDRSEARNARVVYSLDKNVVDEVTGAPIFAVNSTTGDIYTALCCLDREKTPFYALQVVGTDGGGLKGTGTVSVEIGDENDVGPKFSRENWILKVMEESPLDKPIGTISVFDPDITNEFIYRISSTEQKLFDVKSKADGSGGEIYSRLNLDYENAEHRRGFNFKVEVTDAGPTGWLNETHTDASWVTLVLLNKNDNFPQFQNAFLKVSLLEDTSVTTTVATFHARDGDEGESSKVFYNISAESNPGSLFRINEDGNVILVKSLDRENLPVIFLHILASDNGEPSNTATATAEIHIMDINDSPPRLDSGHHFQIVENSPPQVIGKVKLEDPDDWTLGHGPPFTLIMDPNTSKAVKEKFNVSFDQNADSGRGEGEIRSLITLDREETPIYCIPLVAADSGFPSQTATLTVTVIVADVNDNPMTSAVKSIVVHALQPLRSNVPLGRVFVNDPDDWDALEKTYRWRTPHPLFILNSTTGSLFMKPDTKPGRYNLTFHVSDSKHKQSEVPANITVEVRSLTHGDLKTTNPLIIQMDPLSLVKTHQRRTSVLQLITNTVQSWLTEAVSSDSELGDSQTTKVEVISIQNIKEEDREKSRLWIHTPHYAALQNFIMIQRAKQLEALIGAPILDIGSSGCIEEDMCKGKGCWSKLEVKNAFSIIDANETSLVGPELELVTGCGCQPTSEGHSEGNLTTQQGNHSSIPKTESILLYTNTISQAIPKTDTLLTNADHQNHFLSYGDQYECVYNPCLNGGKCLPTSTGFRCICPHNTFGTRCKILMREFEGSYVEDEKIYDLGIGSGFYSKTAFSNNGGGSWAWLPPLPTCSNVHISFEILTSQENSLLMYTGLQAPLQFIKDISNYKYRIAKNGLYGNFGNSGKIKFGPINYKNNLRTRNKFSKSRFVPQSDNLINLTRSDVEFAKYHKKELDNEFETNNLATSQNLQTTSVPSVDSFTLANEQDLVTQSLEKALERQYRDAASHNETSDMLLVELHNGRPNLFLNLGDGIVHIHLNDSYLLNDSKWHRIDILWNKEFVKMFVDFCANSKTSENYNDLTEESRDNSSEETSTSTSFEDIYTSKIIFSPFQSALPTDQYAAENLHQMDRSCKGFSRIPGNSRQLNIRGAPLQLAGVSKSLEGSLANSGILKAPFKGCMKNIRINKELKDLGNSLLSHRSSPGCKNRYCHNNNSCGINGRCDESSVSCLCQLGWMGKLCDKETVPTFFDKQSFVTVALSFTPLSFSTSVQFRFRTWSSDGELVSLSSSLGRDNMSLRLAEGRLCLAFKRGKPKEEREVCLNEVIANDGRWHSVTANRVASSLVLEMDDGDWGNHNSSLSLKDQSAFDISPHDGCHVGGKPQYKEGRVDEVSQDFYEGCIDDLRMEGHSLPLAPSANSTDWAQVTAQQNVRSGCVGEPMCSRFSCPPPLRCFDTWNSYYCGCGEGKRLSVDGTLCRDIDECQWNPCLNGGTCHNSVPGFLCHCNPGFEGKHCEMSVERKSGYPSTVGVVAGIVSLCFFLLIIICVIVLVKRYYSTYSRPSDTSLESDEEEERSSNSRKKCHHEPHIHSIELLDKSILTRTYSCRQPDHTSHPLQREVHLGGSYLDLNFVSDFGGMDPKPTFEPPTRKCKSVTFLTGDAGGEMMYLKTEDIDIPSPPPCKCMRGFSPPSKNRKSPPTINSGRKSKKMSFPIMNPLVQKRVSNSCLNK